MRDEQKQYGMPDEDGNVTIRVVVDDGERKWTEESTGRTRRQAVWLARDRYRGIAIVQPERIEDF